MPSIRLPVAVNFKVFPLELFDRPLGFRSEVPVDPVVVPPSGPDIVPECFQVPLKLPHSRARRVELNSWVGY